MYTEVSHYSRCALSAVVATLMYLHYHNELFALQIGGLAQLWNQVLLAGRFGINDWQASSS